MHKKYKKYLLKIALSHVFLRIKILYKDASLTLSMTFFPVTPMQRRRVLFPVFSSTEMKKEREKNLFSLFFLKYISAYSIVKSGEPNMPSISSKIADGFLALPLAERCCCRSSSSDE